MNEKFSEEDKRMIRYFFLEKDLENWSDWERVKKPLKEAEPRFMKARKKFLKARFRLYEEAERMFDRWLFED